MVPELPIAMLACARLGAPHTVVFGGFSADSLSVAAERHGLRGARHAGRGVAARHDRAAEADRRRGDGRRAGRRSLPRRPAHRQRRADAGRAATTGTTTCAARTIRRRARPSRWTPRICSSSCTRRGTTAKPKGIAHTTGRLPRRRRDDPPLRLRPEARQRRLLVRGRRRLDHRATATSSTGRSATARRR